MKTFIPFDAIRNDFDAAMKNAGYVRAKNLCDQWGISTDKLTRLLKTGEYEADQFIVNGVRYLHKDSVCPECLFPHFLAKEN